MRPINVSTTRSLQGLHWDEGSIQRVTWMEVFVACGVCDAQLRERQLQEQDMDGFFVEGNRKAPPADSAAAATASAQVEGAKVASAQAKAKRKQPADRQFRGVLQSQISDNKTGAGSAKAVVAAVQGAAGAFGTCDTGAVDGAGAYNGDAKDARALFIQEFDGAMRSPQDGRDARLRGVINKYAGVFGGAFKGRLAVLCCDGASSNLGLRKGAAFAIRRLLQCPGASVWRCGAHVVRERHGCWHGRRHGHGHGHGHGAWELALALAL